MHTLALLTGAIVLACGVQAILQFKGCDRNPKVTCYNCRTENCETGSCTGDYCTDYYQYDAAVGEYTYQRGCYTVESGKSCDYEHTGGGGFNCWGTQVANAMTSVCVCESDHCNGGETHKADFSKGSVLCERGTEGALTGTCKGDTCRRGRAGGLGCEYKSGFDNFQPFFPTNDFHGCYRIKKADGTYEKECSCPTAECNKNPLNEEYPSDTIKCSESEPFGPVTGECAGNACFITGVDVNGITGYRRGCVDIGKVGGWGVWKSKALADKKTRDQLVDMAFCTTTTTAGSETPQHTCMCAVKKKGSSKHCNADVDEARESMKATTAIPSITVAAVALVAAFIA